MSALPTLPGMAPGIVAVREAENGKKFYTLQCERCHATEEPVHLVLMTMHFHPRTPNDNPRLCRPCRIAAHPDCTCDGCKSDRTGSIYR